MYCVIPAQTTGDLWHLAAASFLSRAYGRDPTNVTHLEPAELAQATALAGDFGLYFDLWVTVIFHGGVFKIAELEADLAASKRALDAFEASLKRSPGGGTAAQKAEEKKMADTYANDRVYLAELKKQADYGAVLYNFLRQVGVNVMVVFLESKRPTQGAPNALNPKQTSMKTYMLQLTDTEYDYFHLQNQNLLYDSETREVKAFTLDDIMREARLRKGYGGIIGGVATPDYFVPSKSGSNDDNVTPPPRDFSQYRVFGYMVATTIAMQALEDPALRRHRVAELSKHMSQINEAMIYDPLRRPNAPWTSAELARIEKEAQKKWMELDRLIFHLRERRSNQGRPRFILYNHRVNAVNAGTNSSKLIFTAFKNIVKKYSRQRRFETMVVVVNSSSGSLGHWFDSSPVLDLFNKNINAPYPGQEPIVTSRFWNIVANQRDIFGVFSGRTGSVDVAMFNGVNVLWWDEPWLSLSAREPDTMRWYSLFDRDPDRPVESKAFRSWTVSEITSKKAPADSTPMEREARPWLSDDRDQVDQCLRCLQMAAISSVFLVNPRHQPGLLLQHMEERLAVDVLPWLAGTHDAGRDGSPGMPAQDPMPARAYRWPNVTVPDRYNWMWWNSTEGANARPRPRAQRGVCPPSQTPPPPKSQPLTLGKQQRSPIPLTEFRMNIEAGKRRLAPGNQGVQWDPNATWRVQSSILAALARPRQP